MFRRRKTAPAKPQAAEAEFVESSRPVARGPINADARAARWIVGALLLEPNRWHDVQRHFGPKDLLSVDPTLVGLADRYWAHQRDEGEPVFSEFLSVLDEQSKSLAIELAEEVEALSDVQRTLEDAIRHFETARMQREEKQTVAALRRTVDQPPSVGATADQSVESNADDEIELLKRLAAQMARPDIRR